MVFLPISSGHMGSNNNVVAVQNIFYVADTENVWIVEEHTLSSGRTDNRPWWEELSCEHTGGMVL